MRDHHKSAPTTPSPSSSAPPLNDHRRHQDQPGPREHQATTTNMRERVRPTTDKPQATITNHTTNHKNDNDKRATPTEMLMFSNGCSGSRRFCMFLKTCIDFMKKHENPNARRQNCDISLETRMFCNFARVLVMSCHKKQRERELIQCV